MNVERLGAVVVTYGCPDQALILERALSEIATTVVVTTGDSGRQCLNCAEVPNVGYGCAANFAVAHLLPRDTSWTLVFNDDQVLADGGAARIATRLSELPPEVGMWSFTGFSSGLAPRRRTIHGEEELAPHGASLAIRTELLWQLGGFDPRYFLYCEEVDLWLRLPESTASGAESLDLLDHRGGGSTNTRLSSSFELGRSTALLAEKHRFRMQAAVRVVGRSAWVAVRRRRVRAAISSLAGFVFGLIAPKFETVSTNSFGAVPFATRSELASFPADQP